MISTNDVFDPICFPVSAVNFWLTLVSTLSMYLKKKW